MEIWKSIKGYEGLYEISNLGRIKSLRRIFKSGENYCITQEYPERILKNKVYKSGYEYIVLSKDGVVKKFKIHRLVAIAFIENSENKPTVDHINTIRNDNRVENLRWATISENQRNPITTSKRIASKIGEKNPMKARRKEFYQVDIKTNKIIAVHLGVKETAIKLGMDSGCISRCCSNLTNSYRGYFWRYPENYNGVILEKSTNDKLSETK